MPYAGSTLALNTGLVPRVFTVFAADIDFTSQGFGSTGVDKADGNGCREVHAVGTGILMMRGVDGVLVGIDVGAFGGNWKHTCAYDGVESVGTTFVGTLLVTW